MTQLARVERALRKYGHVNTTDFHAPDVIDGGKPILRLAARVRELREAGHRIRSERKLNGTTTYILGAAAPRAAGAGDRPSGTDPGRAVAEVGAPSLFDPEPAPPRRAALEDYEAA